MTFDVCVIGAGVVGSLISRELLKYELKVALLEKENDVAMGATRANSAIVHGGFDAVHGSNKANFNVKGTEMMPKLTKELQVPYINNGSLVLAFDDNDILTLQSLYEQGIKNNVPNLKILNQDELQTLEPNISNEAIAALYSPSAGIVCPYELTIAAAENAILNGLSFYRNCEVEAISFDDNFFNIETSIGKFKSKYIINAAGAFASCIARMIGDESINITPRLGEYYLLDKAWGNIIKHTVFQCPSKMGKGVLVTPTVDGNLLIGPTALDISEKDNVATTAEGLHKVRTLALKSVPSINMRDAITSFAGIRAHPENGDFIIGSSTKNPNMIHAAGIESPGLSAAPAIAKHIADIIKERQKDLKIKADFNPNRKKPIRLRELDDESKRKLIAKKPAYGRVICRCETITEGEIIDAIHSPLPANDVDGIKRRTRSGMGRCQGGFCGSKVLKILSRELGKPICDITKYGGDSNILIGKTK